MAGISKYTRAVLALSAGFVLFCGGWFCAQLGSARPYSVSTARPLPEADYSVTEEAASGDAWPDSLLPGERINVNTADVYDLRRLPGIGEKRARDIIAYREEHGPFQNLDELENVPGIGPSTVEGLREYAEN